MNKTKRNLIIASAIINLLSCVANLVLAILIAVADEQIAQQLQIYYFSLTYNLIYNVIVFAAGLVGSVLLLYSVRNKGKYFRASHACYLAGFIIVVICGGYLAWILLFISMFVSDVVIINRPSEIKREEKMEERAYEDKKQKIEALKKLRDDGVISEEEYKQRLFELL